MSKYYIPEDFNALEVPLDDYFVFEPVSYRASIRKTDKDLN